MDEFNLREGASQWTSAFLTALRCAVYPPMLCMLFVACRMYVLASTHMQGEPPWWVKAGMAAATTGMAVELLVILVLPLAIKEDSAVKGDSLSEALGEPRDVHPMLENLPFEIGLD